MLISSSFLHSGQVFVPSSNQMVDLKHNATKNDANPKLFNGNAKVESGLNNNENYNAASANNDNNQAAPVQHHHKHHQQNSNEQSNGQSSEHKNEKKVYTGSDGFSTSSWTDLQKWIKDRCAKGLSYSYSWKSTWTSKRSIEARTEVGDDEDENDSKVKSNSRKGKSVFVAASKRSLLATHRRLQKKRRSNLLN